MKRFSAIRLNLWLPILIAIIFISMLTAFSLWHYKLKSDQLEERTIDLVKNRMANMQHRIESLLRLSEEGLIVEEIADLGALSEVKFITLIDDNGLILNASNHLWQGKTATDAVPDFDPAQYSETIKSRQLSLKFEASHNQLIAYQPVNLAVQPGMIRPTQVGVLLMNYSLDSAKTRIWNETLRQTGVDILIVIMAMIFLIAVLHHWLSVPLKYLAESARRISEGDFKTHVEFSGKGELAELGAAFNTMQEELQRSTTQMQEYTRELISSKENLAVTLNSIGDAVITTDAAGNVTNMNPVAEELTGWKLSAAMGQALDCVFQIISSQTRLPASNPVHQVIKHGQIVGLANHTSLISKNGTEYHIADSAAPIRNKAGQIDGVILVFHDVSEQYRKQAIIASQEAELRKITNVLPGPVSHVDRDGCYLFVSSVYENWFGKRSQDVIGLTQAEVMGTELYQHFEPYFKRALKGEKLTFEISIPDTEGKTREVFINVIPDFDINNEVCGCFTIGMDISERKLAEQTALQLREQLAQANKMESVGHLTAGIAHDFNNILGAIMGYTELSQLVIANGTPEVVGQYLAEILKGSQRAKELISQMLTFSRLSPDLQNIQAPAIMLSPVVKEVVALLRSSIPSTIELNYQIEDAELVGSIQPIHLHQILLNLGINARDAIGEYGRIDIKFSRGRDIRQVCASCHTPFEGEFITLSVRDSGSGIPANTLNKIFDPFFTTKGVGKGTGMGLSVVHGLVHASGGHIMVESEVGKSTTINILLPLGRPASPMADKAELSPEPKADSLAGLSIMVVDDEVSMATMMHEFLSIHDARSVTFNSPLVALSVFEKAPENFDIVVTDETMPGLSGMHLAARMLKLKPGLPIILCTGFSEHATAELAAKAGLAGFFSKPLQMNALLKKIQEIRPK